MSKKSKQHNKKKKAKAEVEVLSATQLAPDTHFVALEVRSEVPPPKKLTTWESFKEWLDAIWD